jgi:hypothetical protein
MEVVRGRCTGMVCGGRGRWWSVVGRQVGGIAQALGHLVALVLLSDGIVDDPGNSDVDANGDASELDP